MNAFAHVELLSSCCCSKSLDSGEESTVTGHRVFARNNMGRQTADNMRTNPLSPISTDCLLADRHRLLVPNMDTTLAQRSAREGDTDPLAGDVLVEVVRRCDQP